MYHSTQPVWVPLVSSGSLSSCSKAVGLHTPAVVRAVGRNTSTIHPEVISVPDNWTVQIFSITRKNEFILIFILSRVSFWKMIYMYGWGTVHFSTITIGFKWKMRTATHYAVHMGQCHCFLSISFFCQSKCSYLKLYHQKYLYLNDNIRRLCSVQTHIPWNKARKREKRRAESAHSILLLWYTA